MLTPLSPPTPLPINTHQISNKIYHLFSQTISSLCAFSTPFAFILDFVWAERKQKMLAIFKKSVVDPPKELQSPASLQISNKAASPQETMKNFLASNSNDGFSIGFMDKAFLAYSKPPPSSNPQQRYYIPSWDVTMKGFFHFIKFV